MWVQFWAELKFQEETGLEGKVINVSPKGIYYLLKLPARC